MKKRLFAVSSTIIAAIMLGSLFPLAWLLGFLASKYIAGNSVGERGKVRSIVIPLKRWGIHLHHWIYSLFLIILSSATSMHFLTPSVTYGLLGGLVFQGIYCYNDWHVILISRHQTKERKRSVDTSRNGSSSNSPNSPSPNPDKENITINSQSGQ